MMALTELSNWAVVMNVVHLGSLPPMARGKTPILEIDQEMGSCPRSQPLPLLDGFQILDDRAHLVGLEDEFRHVRVTGRNAFGQRLGKPFDFELA